MSSPASHAAVLAYIEEATQSEEGSLPGDVQLKAIVGWDSMGMVWFMSLVEEHHGVELSVFDLRDCETPGDLLACVLKRSGE